MTAHEAWGRKTRRRSRGVFTLPFACLVLLVAAAAVFVSDVLWPTWPSRPTSLDAPAIPITVAGVLFDVPPAAIREAVQRHAGQQERVDLAFEWPSLEPPRPDDKPAANTALTAENAAAAAAETENERLFVTIAGPGRGTAAARAAAQHLSPLRRIPGQRGTGRACHFAVPPRHALCRRGSGLFRQQSRTILRPLHAPGPCGARHLHCGTPARRRRDHVPFSARLVRRLAHPRRRFRPARSRNCIRSEIDRSAGRRSKAAAAARL